MLKETPGFIPKTQSVTPAQKVTWAPCVVAEMVCSEESDDEDEENSTFVIGPLPWRNDKANTPFASFDSKYDKIHSKKCAVMTIYYSESLSSDRTRLSTVPN